MRSERIALSKNLTFALPDWKVQDFAEFTSAQEKLTAIARSSGTSSSAFNASVDKLRGTLQQNDRTISIVGLIQHRSDVRACTHLLANHDDFSQRCVVDRKLRNVMQKVSPGLGRLNIANLLGAYFERYDDLQVDSMKKLGLYLSDALSRYKERGLSVDQMSILQNRKLLFSGNAPSVLAEAAVTTGRRLEIMSAELGLQAYNGGKFLRLCRFAYYIKQLREIQVGSDHEILDYVVEPDVVDAPADNRRLLGHQILEILIDRSSASEVSERWRDVIIQVAGDPRVPPTNMKYMKWWAVLGDRRVTKMRGWLSRLDLKLFLEVLESSARYMNNHERERMFESRKAFMEGLIDQQLVNNSRLFLCGDDVQYLRRHYDKETMPEYAKVHSKGTSMIYLDVKGLHMIEGSHSFKVKVMDHLPSETGVLDYTKRQFSDSELRTSIIDAYIREYRNKSGYLEKTHDVHLNWQHELISFLKQHGVKVSEELVLSPERYLEYRKNSD